ncbi:MAG: hypothetical protein HQM09_08520 [Candidatus Riflebacteria bacterium]|nr:hypothetical protein [Candidatus Riflebacteria bacterium]
MSESRCPSISLLADFRKGRISGSKKNAVEEPLRSWEVCRFTLSLPAAGPSSGFSREAARMFELTTQPRPPHLAFGQIWRIVCPESTPELAVLTFGEKHSLDPERPDLRVCLLVFDFMETELAGRGEIMTEAGESPLERSFLIKTWDERPILADQLDQYFGQLAEQKAGILKETLEMRFTNPDFDGNPGATVLAFRDREIAAATAFSRPYLNHFLAVERRELHETKEIPEIQPLPSGTHIFEIELPAHPLEFHSCNEENPVRYAAKTTEELEERLEMIYGRLRSIRQAKQLPPGVHLERTSDGLSLSGSHDFALQFTFRGKPSEFSLKSHGGKLSIRSKDLADCPNFDGFFFTRRPLRKIL